VVDAGLLEAELKRYMEKNGLSDKTLSNSEGLRIRVNLKKNGSKENKKKRKNEAANTNGSTSKRSRSSIGRKSGTSPKGDPEQSEEIVETKESESFSKDAEKSIYSDVLGMEQRVVKKRGKTRGGVGSRGGKGSYTKRKSVD